MRGYPLTECRDTTELLKAAYDAILAHWILYKRGILHRNINWNNVLCFPPAQPQPNSVLSGEDHMARNCIAKILGEKEVRWCASLTDFDQAVEYNKLEKDRDDQGRPERTRTLMFIAVEKSLKAQREIPEREYRRLNALTAKLSYVEAHHPAIFKLAFPYVKENQTFNANWSAVFENEKDLVLKSCNSIFADPVMFDPSQQHQAYHDVESFYWVFLWSFVRAQPEGFDSAGDSTYKRFCDSMLHCGIRDGKSRFPYLYRIGDYMPSILHPRLRRFSELLIDMAEYISIPWSRYEVLNLPDDHVHLAMLRLLLGAIMKESNETPVQLSRTRAIKSTNIDETFNVPSWCQR